jgi:hypothetical protein
VRTVRYLLYLLYSTAGIMVLDNTTFCTGLGSMKVPYLWQERIQGVYEMILLTLMTA